ncbi:hypothetical protein VOLCADRAFT_98221 [Volvox carteri f. nagariensis]|uniref:Uncharacterized protein n=1 Tax=Volvox carteri f. nagariensis TaxID=3068 RepID=D8UES3_VOLCA|nr:uncharacterized protein VOLCADRAFT_98221 [Volvox carteri f. nagariensis]EFJ41780.1 hypothetical protein VOLCADRAFT_98221 [Volvox carteri f. nagariensis]|eukprot:XP_002957126.1 hypothetical protein VOLCADRAFT_98221 [Volvox carteri f. nagariensis]
MKLIFYYTTAANSQLQPSIILPAKGMETLHPALCYSGRLDAIHGRLAGVKWQYSCQTQGICKSHTKLKVTCTRSIMTPQEDSASTLTRQEESVLVSTSSCHAPANCSYIDYSHTLLWLHERSQLTVPSTSATNNRARHFDYWFASCLFPQARNCPCTAAEDASGCASFPKPPGLRCPAGPLSGLALWHAYIGQRRHPSSKHSSRNIIVQHQLIKWRSITNKLAVKERKRPESVYGSVASVLAMKQIDSTPQLTPSKPSKPTAYVLTSPSMQSHLQHLVCSSDLNPWTPSSLLAAMVLAATVIAKTFNGSLIHGDPMCVAPVLGLLFALAGLPVVHCNVAGGLAGNLQGPTSIIDSICSSSSAISLKQSLPWPPKGSFLRPKGVSDVHVKTVVVALVRWLPWQNRGQQLWDSSING